MSSLHIQGHDCAFLYLGGVPQSTTPSAALGSWYPEPRLYKRLCADWQQHQIICSRRSRLTERYQIIFLRFRSSNLTTHQKHEGYYGNAVVGRSRPVHRRSRSNQLLPLCPSISTCTSILRRPGTGFGQDPEPGQRCGAL